MRTQKSNRSMKGGAHHFETCGDMSSWLRAVCVWRTSVRLLLREEALDETFRWVQVLFYKSHKGLKVDLWIAEKLVKFGIVTPGNRAEFSSG